MQKVTLVRGARQLLTLRGPGGPRRGADLRNLGLIQDGAVLLVDGLIHEVGPTRRLENLALARTAEEIDASGCVVMPGLVDSYIHAVSGPARLSDFELRLGGANGRDIAHEGGGTAAIARSIQEYSPRALEAMALRVVEEAVRHGTTAFGAQSGLGLTPTGETKILRVHAALQKRPVTLASTFLAARVPPGLEDRPDDYVEQICSTLLPLVKRRKLSDFAGIRCGAGSFAPAQACRFLIAARQLGFALKLEQGAVALAVDMGATSLVPASELNEEEARYLARSQTIATLSPGSSFYFDDGRYPPARRLIDSGAAVALGTGYNPETNPSQNMQTMIALACRAMHMTPAEAITAATINAAHALRLAARLGSIEAGKSADLLILGVPDYRELPYHFGMNLVDMVIQSGMTLVKRSEVQWAAR